MKKRRSIDLGWIMACILLSVGMFMSELVRGGSLEPPSVPAPTMKTLDEVEPRIPIPGSSIGASLYTISKSGAYYLTGDRLSSEAGIQVDVDDVSIDLNGFSLIGSGTNSGVNLTGRSNVEIRNGTVQGFYRGIYAGNTNGKGSRVIDVRLAGNGGGGIYLYSTGNLVKDCTIEGNGISASSTFYGIYTFTGSTVTGNIVSDNAASATHRVYGIWAGGNGSMVSGNSISGNGASAGSSVYGLYTGPGSMLANNVSYKNGDSSSGAVYGIYVNVGSTVTSNTSYYNGSSANSTVYGIYVVSGCTVTNNSVYRNGNSATGSAYGIYNHQDNLVDQNAVYYHDTNMNSCSSCTFGLNHAP